MNLSNSKEVMLTDSDALVVVDVQNDFFRGGSLAVPGSNEIITIINGYIRLFQSRRLPVFVTRDWHPRGHISFKEQGGRWPVHCVAGSKGAEFHPDLHLPDSIIVISKATAVDKDAYSGFEGTGLKERLQHADIHRLSIGGLATDYCVVNTVKDALKCGFNVILLQDAIMAVNANPGDGERALEEMIRLGAVLSRFERFA